jgi:hypothetical protein
VILLLLFLILLGCAPVLAFLTAVGTGVFLFLRVLVVAVALVAKAVIAVVAVTITAGMLVGQRLRSLNQSP